MNLKRLTWKSIGVLTLFLGIALQALALDLGEAKSGEAKPDEAKPGDRENR